MKRGWIAWLAVLVPVWITFVVCAHWEPVLRDGWGHVQWHRSFATTPGNVWQFAHDSYVHNNPRFGQVLTLLVYTPGPWHALVTPLVEVLLFYLLALHALGRRPSFARTDDALMFATILAMVALTAPLLGQVLFYRPFTGNYLFSFTIALLFFAPYRMHLAAARPRQWWWIPIMLVAGFAAGMGNEHTGPTFVAVVSAAIIAFWRRGERPAAWMIAGFAGVLAGGLALYFAPAQSIRYNALATSQSLLGRITERGAGDNLKILGGAYAAAWWLLPWVAVAALGWRAARTRLDGRRVFPIVALAASFAIMVTLLMSPKQGGRLDFASICLACAAVASVVVPLLATVAQRVIAWLLAAAGIAMLLYHLIATYSVVGPEFAQRFAAIESAPEHAVVTVSPYTLHRSRWFLGEDFGEGADGLRFGIAWSRHLQGVLLDKPVEANEDPGGL
jgi:hypothetical protein